MHLYSDAGHSEQFSRASSKSKPYKKVRLKAAHFTRNWCFHLSVLIFFSLCIVPGQCNRPPKFMIEDQSEIVLRLKEGAETPVGKCCTSADDIQEL